MKRVGLSGPNSASHAGLAPKRRRYRFVGPPSNSLPMNRFRQIDAQSKRRSEPLALMSARIPDVLVSVYMVQLATYHKANLGRLAPRHPQASQFANNAAPK